MYSPRPCAPFTRGQPIPVVAMESSLSFRELEALARTLLSVLLAFFDSRIACYQSGLFQGRPQIGIEFKQRPGNAMADCSCLTSWTTTTNIDHNIKLSGSIGQLQWLP